MPTEVKRYDCVTQYDFHNEERIAVMVINERGDYIEYKDYSNLLEEFNKLKKAYKKKSR